MAEGGRANVLLLGDNLLAKKTFVNSFAYYLRFARFEEAVCRPDEVRRHYEPSSVKHGGSLRIKYRPSAKKVIKEYKVEGIDEDVRLIDLPTFGNVATDEDALKKSMAFLEHYEDLDAVYIFPRIWQFPSIQFTYFMSFLSVNFEKTMGSKMFLILPLASRDLKVDVVDVTNRYIPDFHEQKVHICDDDAFNSLLACYKGETLSGAAWSRSEKAWQISSIHSRAMLRDLTKRNRPAPYKTAKTLSLHRIRSYLKPVTKAAADIYNAIQHNSVVLKHEKLLGNPGTELERKQREYQSLLDQHLATITVIGSYVYANSHATHNGVFLEYLHYRQTKANQKIKNAEEIKKRFKENSGLIDAILKMSSGGSVSSYEDCCEAIQKLNIKLV